MFTGIIESIGVIKNIEKEGSNLHFNVASPISHELKVDQSVSHNGVCLTVTAVENESHWVTAIAETLDKSNLGDATLEDKLNLERCMKADGRFDGHIVQGHVDTTAEVLNVDQLDGSWIFSLRLKNEGLLVEKGSVCINGTSLTCFDVAESHFSVAIIPYTFDHTNFNQLSVGAHTNIEFDIIGKYIHQILNRK
ncbi:MAG: riboflavin synthase [Bacteroidota bacterium]